MRYRYDTNIENCELLSNLGSQLTVDNNIYELIWKVPDNLNYFNFEMYYKGDFIQLFSLSNIWQESSNKITVQKRSNIKLKVIEINQ